MEIVFPQNGLILAEQYHQKSSISPSNYSRYGSARRSILTLFRPLTIVSQPNILTAGHPLSVIADVEDSSGTRDPTYNGNVSISLASNPGTSALGGTLTVPAAGGVATFFQLNAQ